MVDKWTEIGYWMDEISIFDRNRGISGFSSSPIFLFWPVGFAQNKRLQVVQNVYFLFIFSLFAKLAYDLLLNNSEIKTQRR